MKRIILAAVFQLCAAAAIILSLQPCLSLFLGEHLREGPYGYYEHIYWNYFIIRSWLIALTGIGVGLVLLWISGCIKSTRVAVQSPKRSWRVSAIRIVAILSLAGGAILACFYLPGLSGIFGKNSLDYQKPMDVSPGLAPGMAFMVMTNDLTTPPVQYRPPDLNDIKLALPTNVPVALPTNLSAPKP